ncbi:monocarboxylate transporter 13-like isoform X2 [Lytechinus pictus]|uniref:monocarboxylate transporter 13-like isoform X2 n=1 Tax=Lytechinus pictus TaxID=7653 RepID=UPI0030BA1370
MSAQHDCVSIKQEPYCNGEEDNYQSPNQNLTSRKSHSNHSLHVLEEEPPLACLEVTEHQRVMHRAGMKHPRWWKYIVLFGTFLDFLLVFGFFKGIGVFVVEWQEHFQISSVKAGTITIGTAFVMPFTTPLGGALSQRYGCRPIAIIGGLISSGATFGAAFSPNLPILIILICICGVGMSMTFAPCPAVLGFYFDRHLGFASGIMMSGVGAGILIFPPIIQALCNSYGWQGALLITSAIFAHCSICGMSYRPTPAERFNIAKLRASHSRSPSHGSDIENKTFLDEESNKQGVADEQNVNRTLPKGCFMTIADRCVKYVRLLQINIIWTNRHVALFYTSIVFVSFGYYSSLVYMTARSVYDLGVTKQDASYVLSTMGISSMLSRIAHGPLLDRKIISVFHLAPIALTISGLSSLFNPLANSYILQHLLAISFGIGSGAFNGLCPMLLRSLVDSSIVASSFGLYVMITGFGNLIGTFTLASDDHHV